MVDDPATLLALPPRVPADIGRFTPDLYPGAPSLAPASGHRHSDASIEDVMMQLVGTAGEPVFEAWTEGRTAVTHLRYGIPIAPGRVIGPDATGARVVNDRYRAEDARLLLPSIVHDLLWSGAGAGHAEETVLHALGAYVHAALLARAPALATTGSELARRQSSITITLLNSRRPGSSTVTLVAPDGPGTVPGGAPAMQTPDFWSVPFGSVTADGAAIDPTVRTVLAATAAVEVRTVPAVWADAVGAWCASAFAGVLDPATQLAANRALGLLWSDASGHRRPAHRAALGSVVVVLCAVNLLVAADFLGASVLLDAIGRDLHMSTATLAWVVNGYLLTLAAPLVAFGRAADAVGAVRLTRWGLLAFAVGAALSGTAMSEEMLIAGRMVQGVGASVLTATGLSLVSTTAAPADRGRVIGIWAGVGAVGSAAGPLLAGALEALGSWRIFFLVDVPFALVVLWFLRDARDPARRSAAGPFDVVGVVMLTGGLGTAVFALLAGPDLGWGSPLVIGGAVAAVVLLGGFVAHDARAPDPLLDRRLFGGARYRVVATVAFVGNAAFSVVAFFASLYLQQVQDLEPAAAGAVFLAMTIPLIVLSPRAGVWAGRVPMARLMGGGLAIVSVSVALFAGFAVDDGLGPVIVALVLSGVGQALVFNVSNIAAVDPTVGAAGLESGMINEVRQIGALVGLAVFGALFAAEQAAGHGPTDEVFVDALRLPNLILAALCLVAGAYAWRSRQVESSAPG